MSQLGLLADEAGSLGPSHDAIHVAFVGDCVKLIMSTSRSKKLLNRRLVIILRRVCVFNSSDGFKIYYCEVLQLLLHKLKPMGALWIRINCLTTCAACVCGQSLKQLCIQLIIFDDRILVLPLTFAQIEYVRCSICTIDYKNLLEVRCTIWNTNELDIGDLGNSVTSEKRVLEANCFLERFGVQTQGHICTVWPTFDSINSEAGCRQNFIDIETLAILVSYQKVASWWRKLENRYWVKERWRDLCQHLVSSQITNFDYYLIVFLNFWFLWLAFDKSLAAWVWEALAQK